MCVWEGGHDVTHVCDATYKSLAAFYAINSDNHYPGVIESNVMCVYLASQLNMCI